MEINGRLIQLLPEVSGESARGPWLRGGFVIETDGDYPRKVAFTLFGEERVAMVKNIPMNSPVTVSFNPESREYNEKWYTDLRCTRVQPYVPGQMPAPGTQGYNWNQTPQPPSAPVVAAAAAAAQPGAAAPAPSFASVPASNPDDDLPF